MPVGVDDGLYYCGYVVVVDYVSDFVGDAEDVGRVAVGSWRFDSSGDMSCHSSALDSGNRGYIRGSG